MSLPLRPQDPRLFHAAARAWDAYWFGPVAALRPYALAKIVYVVLALDAWLLRVPVAWRYGAGGFDVAHFGWLDALQPLPSAAFYTGLMLVTGVLAMVCALANAGWRTRLAVAALWTYGWMMSLADTYQHHYFLSLVLVLLAAMPPLSGRQALPVARRAAGRGSGRAALPAPLPMTSAWPYALLTATVAIVYAYTTVTKLDLDWRAGRVMEHLGRPRLGTLGASLEGLGEWQPALWAALSAGVVLTEMLLAAGYLLAPRLDTTRRPLLRVLAWVVFAAALSLHLTAELVLKLRIGWFSYYMIALASVCLLPGPLLARLAGVLARLVETLAEATPFTGPRAAAVIAPRGLGVLGAAAVFVCLGAGAWLGLPGAWPVGAALALLMAALTALALAGRQPRRTAQYMAATGFAVLVMWVSVVSSRARVDYYVEKGMDLAARGDPRGAAVAFGQARRYQGGRAVPGRAARPLPPRRVPDAGTD